MPIEPKITIEGLRELNRAFRQVGSDAVGELKDVHLEAAKDVEQAARMLVPRRTGRLESTLRSSGTMRGARVRAGFARVPYAGPIHFGWPARNIRPQPFLYDAIDKRRREVLEIYQRNIEALIRKHDL